MPRLWGSAALLALGCDSVVGLDDLVGRESRPAACPDGWVKHVAAPGRQALNHVAVDGAGNIHLAGTFQGSIDLGGGPHDAPLYETIIVAKLAPDGSHLWSLAFGDPTTLMVWDMALSPIGTLAVVGHFSGVLDAGGTQYVSSADDGFLLMVSPNGELIAAFVIGGEGKQRVARASFEDALWLAGDFDTEAVFPRVGDPDLVMPGRAGDRDLFLATYGPGGHGTVAVFGDEADQRVGALAADGADVILAGTSYGAVDFGETQATSAGAADVFVARRSDDAAATWLWSASYGSAEKNCHDWCELELAVDAAGDAYLAGAVTGDFDLGTGALFGAPPADIFLTRLARDGQAGRPAARFARMLASPYEERPHASAVDSAGNLVLAGLYSVGLDLGGGPLGDSLDGSRDLFLASFDGAGAHRWSFALPMQSNTPDDNPDFPGFPGLAVAPGDRLVLVSPFRGVLTVGGATLASVDGDADQDAVIAKLCPPAP